MYQPEPDKGYPPSAPCYPQPGAGYPPPPPYGVSPQPPYGVSPQPPYGVTPQPTAIITPVATTTVVMTTSFADTPVACMCPVCRQNIVTRTEFNTGLLTWLIFGILLFFGCWLGCCLIPFCVDGCKDVDHFCPNCNHHLSKYKRM